MAVNKVVFGNTTVMDITDSTVTANKLKSGEYAYGANGQKIVGTLEVPEVLDDLSDVVITTPQTAQEIYFDGTNWINYGAKIVLTFDDDFKGQTITLTKGQTTITKTAPLDSNTMNLYINETGLWTISSEISGDTYETEVNVTTFGASFDAVLSSVPPIPEGATVLPTDDIQTWLKCANITDKAYTTLAEVLADRETFETLIRDSNACDYMARSTTWAVNEGAVPTMTSDTTPSGVASANSYYSSSYPAWKAFNKIPNDEDCWVGSGSANLWLQYEFPQATIIKKVSLVNRFGSNANQGVKLFEIQASNSNFVSDSKVLYEGEAQYTPSSLTYQNFVFDNNDNYKYYRIFIKSNWGNSGATTINELQFYEDADITTDSDVMSLIGKYDYCSNALLGNATWAEAIANSDYFEEVLNVKVPVMTSNTTPSGEVIAPNQHNNYPGYYAFDQNTSTRYSPVSAGTFPDSVTYDFKKQVKIVKFSVMAGVAGTIKNFQIRGSNDNNTWTTLYSGTYPNSQAVIEDVLTTIGDYRYYQIYEEQTAYLNYLSVAELQFYGRASTQTNIIHSAPNDTIYMMENGSQVVLTTTNSDGVGILDFSTLEDKEYTFYSSVAKDPSNLSNDFSKTIRITKSEFGGTTEMYLIPNGALYWYGNTCDWLTGGLNKSLWKDGASNSYTLNVNDYYFNSTVNNSYEPVYYYVNNVTCEGFSILKAIAKTNITSRGKLGAFASKNTNSMSPQSSTTISNSYTLHTVDVTNYQSSYPNLGQFGVGVTMNIQALWLE